MNKGKRLTNKEYQDLLAIMRHWPPRERNNVGRLVRHIEALENEIKNLHEGKQTEVFLPELRPETRRTYPLTEMTPVVERGAVTAREYVRLMLKENDEKKIALYCKVRKITRAELETSHREELECK